MRHASRILKETKSLAQSGLFDEIFLLGIGETGFKEQEKLDARREIWRVPLKTQNFGEGTLWKVLKFCEWQIKIFFRFIRKHVSCVNCHCLSTLPIGMLFKICKGSKLVYDAHELETEVIAATGMRKKLVKVVEKLLIRFVDLLIVVSDSIAGWYRSQYPLQRISVIKNVPYRQDRHMANSRVLKEKFKIRENEWLFIYQGLLSEGRGIKLLLNVFSQIDPSKHIVFMGTGIFEGLIREYEKKFPNIHLQPAVKPDAVITYTQSADVGISLIENLCLNYYYSLPNKVFEYILSGLPVIVSDFPDMGKLVDDYICGWKVSVNEESVINLINRISQKDIEEKRRNVLKCQNTFNWEEEEKKLLRAYLPLTS